MMRSAASGPVGYGSALTFVVIGRRGGWSPRRDSTPRNGPDAGATIAEWNAWLTGIGWTVMPRARKRSAAASAASEAPAMTVWLGQFLFAAMT